jgi:hypothetical protein
LTFGQLAYEWSKDFARRVNVSWIFEFLGAKSSLTIIFRFKEKRLYFVADAAMARMQCTWLSAIKVLCLVLLPYPVIARLEPPGKVWIHGFDPPYDDRTIRMQLKSFDWWNPFQDRAVLPKGTKLPILTDECESKPEVCPTYSLAGDVAIQFGTTTLQDAHRICEQPDENKYAKFASPSVCHAVHQWVVGLQVPFLVLQRYIYMIQEGVCRSTAPPMKSSPTAVLLLQQASAAEM